MQLFPSIHVGNPLAISVNPPFNWASVQYYFKELGKNSGFLLNSKQLPIFFSNKRTIHSLLQYKKALFLRLNFYLSLFTMKATRLTNVLLVSIAIVIIMIYGKKLLIPFVLALIFWFLIKEIRELFMRIPWVYARVPRTALNLIGFIFIFALIGGVVKILIHNIQQLSGAIPAYQENVKVLANTIYDLYGFDLYAQIKEFLGEFKFSKILTVLFTSFREVFGDAVLIIIYTVFLLLEESFFPRKIRKIYSPKSDYEDVFDILTKIDKSIGRYISIKTLTSLITGVMSYIALILIGIDAPLFWAFLIFIMNFIPAVGSLIATVFPAMFAILQFGEIAPAIWTLSVVGAIQLFIGNYVDPRMTGDSLNVSPLVVIFGLVFWGSIWGVIGMMLSVPISVMLIIVLSQIPATRPAAILLSKRGNVQYKARKDPHKDISL
jgi:predicted PurR-regulated permease PerM